METYETGKDSKGKNPVNKDNQLEIDKFITKFEADYLVYISGENTGIEIMEMYEYILEKLGKVLGLR